MAENHELHLRSRHTRIRVAYVHENNSWARVNEPGKAFISYFRVKRSRRAKSVDGREEGSGPESDTQWLGCGIRRWQQRAFGFSTAQRPR